jgi:hypothetical protein
MTGRDAAEVIAAVLCAEMHPDSTWVCDPEAADPRNRIPACYACQRGAAALVAEGIGVLAEAWDEGYEAAEYMARCWGHTDHWEDEPANPHRIEAAP